MQAYYTVSVELVFMKFTWSSFKKAETPKTLGRLLHIDLPQLGVEDVIAKVDTGACSGALHATHIREIDHDGMVSLRFSPLGSAEHTLEMGSFHKRRVRSSNGKLSVRYAIDTEIRMEDQTYPITLTLTNRGSMRHPMLIGRNFLRIHGFLIDVTQNSK
jgi:hypothetical protein